MQERDQWVARFSLSLSALTGGKGRGEVGGREGGQVYLTPFRPAGKLRGGFPDAEAMCR